MRVALHVYLGKKNFFAEAQHNDFSYIAKSVKIVSHFIAQKGKYNNDKGGTFWISWFPPVSKAMPSCREAMTVSDTSPLLELSEYKTISAAPLVAKRVCSKINLCFSRSFSCTSHVHDLLNNFSSFSYSHKWIKHSGWETLICYVWLNWKKSLETMSFWRLFYWKQFALSRKIYLKTENITWFVKHQP